MWYLSRAFALHPFPYYEAGVTASVENYGILIYCACYKTSIFELNDFRLSSYVEAGIGSLAIKAWLG